MDHYENPLTDEQIEAGKQEFIKFHGSLDHCACVGCPLQLENRCIFQFDVYNTDDDFCLMEK